MQIPFLFDLNDTLGWDTLVYNAIFSLMIIATRIIYDTPILWAGAGA